MVVKKKKKFWKKTLSKIKCSDIGKQSSINLK